MKSRAVVISGRIGSGKSTLARKLADALGADLVRSKSVILEMKAKTGDSLRAFQLAGESLDKSTKGEWLAQRLSQRLASAAENATIVVDSVFIPQQVEAFRRMGWEVTHIHLEASEPTLKKRFLQRSSNGGQSGYALALQSKSERQVTRLREVADSVIDTDRCTEEDVFCRVMARLGSRLQLALPLVDVLVGGQYGSEGKGNIANYLAPEYDVLVRVGSINAGHKVFIRGGEPFTFRQLPSGAWGNPDATLVLGAGAVIGLEVLFEEISKLNIPVGKLVIDPQAMVIEKSDQTWEKKNLETTISSTAQGVGRATARKILFRKPNGNVRLAKDIKGLKHYLFDTVEYYASCMAKGQRVLLEGTQGTTLSLHHGFYPHVTSRMTTADACLAEAGLSSRHVRRIMMVCRTYPIRVGDSSTGETSGKMKQELTLKEIARRSGISHKEIMKVEKGSVSGKQRRICEFDWEQLRRSVLLNGPTDIALTFADHISVSNREAFRYEQLTPETLRFIEELEAVCGISVSLISTAFNDRNIIDRRKW